MSKTQELKRQAMDAISNVETIAQVGLMKMTGGVAAYVGRVREADAQMQAQRTQRSQVRQRTVETERLT